MLYKHRPRPFRHSFIFVNDRKDKIDAIRKKAVEEISAEHGEYRASKIRGFLTDNKLKHRLSTATSVLLLVICIVLWYFLKH